ncbi:hypothetical protein B0T17DRAFT_508337 [Bombardia bombarda]|uniref:Uncharacterized protein n=1 Tax=Bombardia bombarda TaxID=252184 RepID=A0AA40C515_9PEZI|nr:hypothetical protein B0T17DRAFT_508337 [Bombardia bombarda]
MARRQKQGQGKVMCGLWRGSHAEKRSQKGRARRRQQARPGQVSIQLVGDAISYMGVDLAPVLYEVCILEGDRRSRLGPGRVWRVLKQRRAKAKNEFAGIQSLSAHFTNSKKKWTAGTEGVVWLFSWWTTDGVEPANSSREKGSVHHCGIRR